MIRFLFKVSLFLPVLLGMTCVNWSVDPAMVFGNHRTDPSRHRYETLVAQDLLAGRSHYFIGPFSEWIIDELVFRERPEIDSLIFGSSIGKPIHEGLFGSPLFFNTSMFGGRIEDMVAMYQMALDHGLRPRHVLIEIDARALGHRPPIEVPQLLAKARKRLHVPDETQRQVFWTAILQALVPLKEVAGSADEQGPFYPYYILLSPRYFQFSFEYLIRSWMSRNKGPKAITPQFGEPNRILLYPDGSIEWSDNFRVETPASLRLKFDNSKTDSFASEEYRPVADKCRLCEAFVADLLQSGVEVDFLLLAPNPRLFEAAEEEAKRAGETLPSVDTEAYIRSLAEKYKVRVYGSVDPRRLGVQEEDYVDDVHLRREALERLLKHYRF